MKLKEFTKLKKGTDILFKGMKFTIPWDVKEEEGDIPLCTRKQFQNFNISYGHIFLGW